MDRELFLGIDQGGSATKALLIDEEGNELWSERFLVQHQEEEGLPEQIIYDAKEILQGINGAMSAALATAPYPPRAIGFSFQRSAVCAWDPASREPFSPVYPWNNRSLGLPVFPKELFGSIKEKTTLPVIPDYAAGKISSLRKSLPGARIGTLDSLIHDSLSDNFATDDTMASRTLLYDLNLRAWCPEIAEGFGISLGDLPKIRPSISRFGTVHSVPVTASAGDAQCALISFLGAGDYPVLTLGSVASLTIPTGIQLKKKSGFFSSVLYSSGASPQFEFLLEAVTTACGLILEEVLKCVDKDELTPLTDSSPVAFIPWRGTGSPHWRYDLTALSSPGAVNEGELGRVLLEALGSAIVNQLEEFQGDSLWDTMLVGGGGARSDYLLQFIADCSGLELQRVPEGERSARGAAILAAVGSGRVVSPRSISEKGKVDRFVPTTVSRRLRFEQWKDLYERSLNGARKAVDLDLSLNNQKR